MDAEVTVDGYRVVESSHTTYQRPKGQGNCVMTKEIPAS